MLYRIIIVALLSLCILPSHAKDRLTLIPKQHWGAGSYQALTLSGETLFVGSSSGLDLFDISETSPVKLGSLDLSAQYTKLAVYGNTLFGINNLDSSGLDLLDISDLANPTRRSTFQHPNVGFVRDIHIDRYYLYLLDQAGRVSIFDLQAASGPQWLHTVELNPTGGNIGKNSRIYQAYNKLYIGAQLANGDAQLYTIDTSIPQSAALSASLLLATNAGGVTALIHYDEKLYLSTGWNGFLQLSLQNPLQPSILNQRQEKPLEHASALYRQGYNLIGVGADNKAFALDISDPDNPHLTQQLLPINISAIAQGPSGYWLAAGSRGLAHLSYARDQDDNWQFSLTQHQDISGWAQQLLLHNEQLYLAHHMGGLRQFSLSNLPALELLNTWHETQAVNNLSGSISHLFAGLATQFSVFSSAPFQLTATEYHNGLGSLTSHSISHNNTLYLFTNGGDMQIYDISDATYPQLRGSVNLNDSGDTANYIFSSAISDNYLYLATRTQEVMVLDITVPESPILLPSITLDGLEGVGYVKQVEINNSLLFVATDVGLVIVDISEPDAPFEVNRINPDLGYKLTAAGLLQDERYYLAMQDTIYVIDVSTPKSLEVIESLTMDIQRISDLTISNQYLIVATGTAGKLHIVEINEPPQFTNTTYTGKEDTPLTGTLNAIDNKGEALYFGVSDATLPGTLTWANDAEFTFQPDPDFFGELTFNVTATDIHEAYSSATITLQIEDVNDKPTLLTTKLTTTEETPIKTTLAFKDIEGDAVSFSLQSKTDLGALELSKDGVLHFTPDPDISGTEAVLIQLQDARGQIETAELQLTVTEVNDIPSLMTHSLTLKEDTTITGQLKADDAEQDEITFALINPSQLGHMQLSRTGEYSFVPLPNQFGTETLSLRLSDGVGGEQIADLTITISPIDDAPTLQESAIYTDENQPVSGKLVANDIEGDIFSFEPIDNSTIGTLTLSSNGDYQFTPYTDIAGSEQVSVKLTDKNNASFILPVDIYIGDVNHKPELITSLIEAQENVTLTGQLSASDRDKDPLLFTLNTASRLGHFLLQPNGSFVFTPSPGIFGTEILTVSVDDQQGGVASYPFMLKINSTDFSPILVTHELTTQEDTVLTGQLTTLGSEQDRLTFSLSSKPTLGWFTLTGNGSYSFIPLADKFGTETLTIVISDGKGEQFSTRLSLSVIAVNDPPQLKTTQLTLKEDTPLSGQLIATDTEHHTLSFKQTSNSQLGQFSLTRSGKYNFIPTSNRYGFDVIKLEITDELGGKQTTQLSIEITAENDLPTLITTQIEATEDVELKGTIEATDADGDPIQYRLQAPSTLGNFSIDASGNYHFIPKPNTNGSETLQLVLHDTKGSVGHPIQLTVNGVNDLPQTESVTLQVKPGEQIKGELIATDVEDNILQFTPVSSSQLGTLELSIDGHYTFTAQKIGKEVIRIEVEDGDKGISTTQLAIVVLADGVTADQSIAFEVQEGDSYSNRLMQDGLEYQFDIISHPTFGALTIDNNGNYSYSANWTDNDADFAIIEAATPEGKQIIIQLDITLLANPTKTAAKEAAGGMGYQYMVIMLLLIFWRRSQA